MDDTKLSLSDHATREDKHAGQVLSTAKLVTPFSAAFAATFVTASLQVGKPSPLDYIAAWAMVPVLVITVGIVMLRKATLAPDDFPKSVDSPFETSSAHWKFIENTRKNMYRADWVHRAMVVQVLLSAAASGLAIIEIICWLRAHPPQ